MDRVLSGLPSVVLGAFDLYEFILFVYCIMSFVPSLYNSRLGNFVVSLVDPFLNLIRRYIPVSIGMLDFSPIIAIIILRLLQKAIFLII